MAIHVDQLSKQEFWELTESTRTATGYAADKNLAIVREAKLSTVRDACLQYRFFTKYFCDDLAMLAYRSPRGSFKSQVSQMLYDELGNGDHRLAHLELYDSFLTTIGVSGGTAERERRGDPSIIAMLEELRRLTRDAPLFYSIGVRGMAGECLCQVYLEMMNSCLRANPAIKPIAEQIDWRFWEIHAGQEDKTHRVRTREVIDDIVGDEPDHLEDLKAGYLKGKTIFDEFWIVSDRRARMRAE